MLGGRADSLRSLRERWTVGRPVQTRGSRVCVSMVSAKRAVRRVNPFHAKVGERLQPEPARSSAHRLMVFGPCWWSERTVL